MLLEPEPHIPDVPDVSSIPEEVDIAGDVNVSAFDGVGTPGIGRVPGLTAAAGAEAPGVVPPPSYIALDPYISEGEVAVIEHAVPVFVAGMEIVPAKPVGAGLTPADVISVEPNGIPVGELEPIVRPSGEVAPIVGVGITEPSTCAIAVVQTISAGRTAAITASLALVLLLKLVSPILETVDDSRRDFPMSTRCPASCDVAAPVLIGFATSSPGAAPSDIGQSPVPWSMLTPEAGGLPTRFAEFPMQTVAILLWPTAGVSTAKWQIAKTVQLNMGLSQSTSDMIDPAAQIARVARPISHREVSDTELGSNRENFSHFRDSED